MAVLTVRLTRQLRKNILRGHPWVFKEALEVSQKTDKAQLCKVFDGKELLGWGIYDPHSVIALRILSTEEAPPGAKNLEERFQSALHLRRGLAATQTNAFRLFNGEGDLVPGLVCDVYDKVAVVQFDGQGPGEFWDRKMISEWLLKNSGCTSIIEKNRRNTERAIEHLAGEPSTPEVVVLENGVKFKVQLEKGQKTGFFLDQRENRDYIRRVSSGQSVLNLFSYTGGFSMYAGMGGAQKVASLDVAAGAIEMAEENWLLNGLPKEKHTGLCVDVFDYLKDSTEKWDHIIVDPPSMGHSEVQKSAAVKKYVGVFLAAIKNVKKNGQISLSSCSSHISFNDFFEIIDEALSQARRKGRILRVSGQGFDHPFPHACHELRYLKFVHLAL